MSRIVRWNALLAVALLVAAAGCGSRSRCCGGSTTAMLPPSPCCNGVATIPPAAVPVAPAPGFAP
jgi:hypothetical protein